MFKWIKGKLGSRSKTPEIEFLTPYRVALHSTIHVNTVDFVGLEGAHPAFKAPTGSALDVIGIGTIDNEPDTIYRIYVVDYDETPYMIQLNASFDPRSGNQDITEVMFFQRIEEYEPLTQKEWDLIPKQVGTNKYILNNLEYNRIWGDNVNVLLDLFVFDEQVVELHHGQAGPVKTNYTNHQMLFGRSVTHIKDEITEYLLMGIEESQEGDLLTTQIGYIIPPQAITIQ